MQDALRHQVFNEGDSVHVTGPIAEPYVDMIGVVRTVSRSGSIFRYFVEFVNEVSDTFFGFELRRVEEPSAAHSA
jgi:hypothetical protein